MKNKILWLSALILVFAMAGNVYVLAKNENSGSGTGTGNGTGTDNTIQVQQETQTANQGENEQVQVQIKNQEQEQEQNRNQVNAEEHKSAVADSVQSLLNVANRAGEGIGQQIKIIAEEQNQSEETMVQAMEKVQTRSQIKTFFMGTDYKNLGVLRSEMVQTQNRLQQLNTEMEKIQNQADKTELQNQIQALTQEQEKIENFIKTEEGRFSLFGWFVKLFNK